MSWKFCVIKIQTTTIQWIYFWQIFISLNFIKIAGLLGLQIFHLLPYIILLEQDFVFFLLNFRKWKWFLFLKRVQIVLKAFTIYLLHIYCIYIIRSLLGTTTTNNYITILHMSMWVRTDCIILLNTYLLLIHSKY